MVGEEPEETPKPSVRKQDLAFEALVRETRANPHFDRGSINKALKGIRDAALQEGILAENLPLEIGARADLYRRRWPGIELTPTALAKHWLRVGETRKSRTQTAYEIASDEARRMERR